MTTEPRGRSSGSVLPHRSFHRCGSLLLFTAALVALPHPAPAQILAGRVLDEQTGAAVMDAEIRLLSRNRDERATVVTDSSGWFQVRVPGAGRYSVTVRHIAYAAFDSEPLEIAAGQAMTVEIRLGREAIPLEPLVVTARRIDRSRLADFRRRAASNPFGRFVTREEIDRRPAAEVSDYFRTMPSVTVVPVNRNGRPDGLVTNLVLMRGGGVGQCAPTLYLDGVRIDQSSSFPIDDIVQPGFLEGIEVYRAGSAPAEFMDSSGCGVILFWTREGEGTGRRGWIRHVIGGVAALALLLLIAEG